MTKSIFNSPLNGIPVHRRVTPAFCRYPFIHPGEERHRGSKVSCLRTQHNVPGQDPNPDHTNHEATAPSKSDITARDIEMPCSLKLDGRSTVNRFRVSSMLQLTSHSLSMQCDKINRNKEINEIYLLIYSSLV